MLIQAACRGAQHNSTLGGMNIRLAPHVVAGWLFGLAALTFVPFWYIALFVAIPGNFTVWEFVKDELHYFFSSANPNFWMYVWLVALPVLCVLMSVAYLSKVTRTKKIRILLFGAGVLLAIGAFALPTKIDFGFFVALPSLWGFLAIRAT